MRVFLILTCVTVAFAGDILERNTVAWIEGMTHETSGDLEYHRQYFREDSQLNWGFAPDPMHADNVQEVVATHKSWWEAMPDLKVSVEDIFSSGDRLAVTMRGVSKATGQDFTVGGIFRGVGGKLVEGNWHGDFSNILMKLGKYDPCVKAEKEEL